MKGFTDYIKSLEDRIETLEKLHELPVIYEAEKENDSEEEKEEEEVKGLKMNYYAEWGRYQHKQDITDIDWDNWDYILYAFVLANPTKKDLDDANLRWPPKPYYPELPEGTLTTHDGHAFHDNMKKLGKNSKKTLLSLGGWTLSFNLSKILRTWKTRNTLILSIVDYINKYDLAGFEIDFEYPARKGRSGNKNKSNQYDRRDGIYLRRFFKELRKEMPDKLIMCAVGTAPEVIECYKGCDEYVDYILPMLYNYSGAGWGDEMETHSDIETDKYWLEQFEKVFPKNKIVVGCPLYFNVYNGQNPSGKLTKKPYGQSGRVDIKDVVGKFDIKTNTEEGYDYFTDDEGIKWNGPNIEMKKELAKEYNGIFYWQIALAYDGEKKEYVVNL